MSIHRPREHISDTDILSHSFFMLPTILQHNTVILPRGKVEHFFQGQ